MKKRKEVTFIREVKSKCLVGFERGEQDANGNRVDVLEFENEVTKETWQEEYFRTSDGRSILIGGASNVLN